MEYTEEENNRTLTIVTVLALGPMDNLVLAAANNALNFTGKIAARNAAFESMYNANLIKDDGSPYDKESLLDALSYEINRRVDAGTFV